MTAEEPSLTVGRTADLAGVSVKTLHHWDAIGLVRPSGRTWAGYRVYDGDDIGRIHRVLVYRELGLPLAEIARILDDPDTDARDQLRRQRTQLAEHIDRLRRMLRAVDRMVEAAETRTRLTLEEQAEIFGADARAAWAEEAEERWGGTEEWAQFTERAAAMSPADRKDASAAVEELHAEMAAALRAGVTPGSEEAAALAERHRAAYGTFFDCTHARHVCLGRLFAGDPRFTATYDAIAPGLAGWLRDAINANAAAHGVDPAAATWDDA